MTVAILRSIPASSPESRKPAIARVLNTDLPSLDVTKWQYYTCPAITQSYRCPGGDPANWTSNFADRTQVARLMIPFGSRYIAWNGFFGVAYIKEFKSYLMTGYQNRSPGGLTATTFATAPVDSGTLDHNTLEGASARIDYDNLAWLYVSLIGVGVHRDEHGSSTREIDHRER